MGAAVLGDHGASPYGDDRSSRSIDGGQDYSILRKWDYCQCCAAETQTRVVVAETLDAVAAVCFVLLIGDALVPPRHFDQPPNGSWDDQEGVNVLESCQLVDETLHRRGRPCHAVVLDGTRKRPFDPHAPTKLVPIAR